MLRNTHHDQNAPCQHVLLARGAVGEIGFCRDCGVVHVALQYFTIRLELEAFDALRTMFGEAHFKIAQQAHVAPTAGDAFATVH